MYIIFSSGLAIRLAWYYEQALFGTQASTLRFRLEVQCILYGYQQLHIQYSGLERGLWVEIGHPKKTHQKESLTLPHMKM